MNLSTRGPQLSSAPWRVHKSGGIMKRQPQVTEQTRANLREAFWDLYAERPIERISVREITDRAGYNRATFYLYYHDVYELLNEIESTVLGNIERLVQGRLLQGHARLLAAHGPHPAPRTALARLHARPPGPARRPRVLGPPQADHQPARGPLLPARGPARRAGERHRARVLPLRHPRNHPYLDGRRDPMPIDQLIQLVMRIVR